MVGSHTAVEWPKLEAEWGDRMGHTSGSREEKESARKGVDAPKRYPFLSHIFSIAGKGPFRTVYHKKSAASYLKTSGMVSQIYCRFK